MNWAINECNAVKITLKNQLFMPSATVLTIWKVCYNCITDVRE